MNGYKTHRDNPIDTMVHAVTNEPNVSKAVQMFLAGVVQLTHCDRGTIYRLCLDQSKYLPLAQYDKTGAVHQPPDPGVDVKVLLKPLSRDASVLEKAIVKQEPINHFGTQRIFIPVIRGESCLGVLALEPYRLEGDEIKYLIELAQGLLLSLFERQTSLELLGAVQRPIDFTQSIDPFLDEVMLLVAEASKMPLILLHQWHEDTSALHCLAKYGFGDVEDDLLNCGHIDSFPFLVTAVRSGQTVRQPTLDEWFFNAFGQREELAKIKSLVIAPVKVGSGIYGTLSFGAMCPFDFSPLDQAGFESIANGIGTAITNQGNAQLIRDISIADARIGLAISGLEVAQAARHEVVGAVDDCLVNLATMKMSLRKESLHEIEKIIGTLEDRFIGIKHAIEKIRNASRVPEDRVESASLQQIWQEARALVSAKLTQEHIEARITFSGKEKDICIDVLPDSLRHAFLHLLLNSIDAFKIRKKSDRKIAVHIDPQGGVADIKIRYSDNATGIDPSQFEQWIVADPTKDIKSLIFEKGVTTKPSGSGYGLYLVRSILQRHHGSIDLISHRNGVVFEIVLPKNLKARLERRELKQ